MINLYEIIDKEKYEIPIYVVADGNNMPNVSAENADICVIMAKMMDIQKSIDLMRNQLNEVLKVNSNLKKVREIKENVRKNRANMPIIKKYRV